MMEKKDISGACLRSFAVLAFNGDIYFFDDATGIHFILTALFIV